MNYFLDNRPDYIVIERKKSKCFFCGKQTDKTYRLSKGEKELSLCDQHFKNLKNTEMKIVKGFV